MAKDEPSFLEKLKNWLSESLSFDAERGHQNRIKMMQDCKDVGALDAVWNAFTDAHRQDPTLQKINESLRKALNIEDEDTFGEMWKKTAIKPAIGSAIWLADEMGDFMAKMIKEKGPEMTDVPLSPETIAAFGNTDMSQAYQGSISYIVDIIMSGVDKEALEDAEKTGENIRRTIDGIITGTAGTVAALGIPVVIGDLFQPNKQTSGARLLNMMMDTVGFRAMRDAQLKPLRYGLIQKPMEYKWNSILRPNIPTQGEITGLARKYEITQEKYEEAMGMLGVKQEWITALYTGFWADPRLFEIIRLMEVDRPDPEVPKAAKDWLTKAGFEKWIGPDWWLAMKFGKAGYDRGDIDVLIKVIKARNLQKELGDMRTIQRNMYKGGALTRDEYEKILAARSVGAEEMKPLIDVIDTEIAQETRKEYQRAYEREFIYGRIDVDEATKKLTDIGLREDYVVARIKYLSIMRAGKLSEDREKYLSKAEVLRIYEKGGIERGEAYRRLDNMGYVSDDIELLLTERELKMEEEVEEIEKEVIKPLSKAEVISLYKKGLISRAGADAYLVGFEYLPEDVELLLEKADIEIEEAERKAAEKIEREAEREAAEARRPVRLLSKADILRLYGGFLMTREEAVFHLEELGWAPSAAAILLSYEDSKITAAIEKEEIPAGEVEEKKTRLLSKAEAISLYKKGLISRTEIPVRLAALGYSPPDVEMFVRVLDIDADQEKIIALFLDGFINREEAKTRLESAGYFPSDVERMLVEAEKEK